MKALRGPHLGRCDGNRNHRHAGVDGQPGAAALVLALLPALHARAFGEHDDPGALGQQRPLPCCTTLLNALARRLRSMWIMSSRPMDQPKNGTYSSSFLNT